MMIGQLLKITSTPIQYEFEIEPARLEMRNRPLIPFADVKTTPPQQRIHTENTTVNIDTYEARKSLGLYSVADLVRMEAQKGRQQVLQATANAAQTGWEISENYHKGVGIAELAAQKMLQQPGMVMEFLPKGGAQLSWNPAVCDLSYQMGNVDYSWERPDTIYEYVRGSFSMNIIQRPSVEIEYVGQPMYVPPSSAPNFDETA